MSDVNKINHDAADLFGYWAETDNGEDVWAHKSEDEIMDDLGIDRDDPRNEKRFEAAAAKIDEMARREGWTNHNGREYLTSVIEREVKSYEKDLAERGLREAKAREVFMTIAYVYAGNASDLAEYDPDKHADKIKDEIVPMSDEAVLKELNLSTDRVHDADMLDKAARRVQVDAERQKMKVTFTDAREFLQTVSDRHFGQQSEMTKSYFDRAESRRAAEAAESNARLEQLEASRAAERSQKQAQAPRVSM